MPALFSRSIQEGSLAPSLLRFIVSISGTHQLGLALLSILLFSIGTVPLELQRRIINTASSVGPYTTIVLLAALYGVLVLLEGSIKLLLNVYRNWVGECAIRWLRFAIFDLAKRPPEPKSLLCLKASSFHSSSPKQSLSAVFLPQFSLVPLMQNAINRRVGLKTGIMREVSNAIVKDGTQRPRIQSLFSLNMSIYKIKFTMNFLMNLMTQLGYVGILSLGGYFVATGKTEVGTLVAFISGLAKINDPWGDLVDWYRSYRVNDVKYDLVVNAIRGGIVNTSNVDHGSELLSLHAHD